MRRTAAALALAIAALYAASFGSGFGRSSSACAALRPAVAAGSFGLLFRAAS